MKRITLILLCLLPLTGIAQSWTYSIGKYFFKKDDYSPTVETNDINGTAELDLHYNTVSVSYVVNGKQYYRSYNLKRAYAKTEKETYTATFYNAYQTHPPGRSKPFRFMFIKFKHGKSANFCFNDRYGHELYFYTEK